jgi:diguanylate cyclase (GGDEF)-like protein/PAS domain S-box-containing protein
MAMDEFSFDEAHQGLFKALFDASPDAQLVVGRDGVIRFANVRAHDLFGCDLLTLAGQPVEILAPGLLHETRRALNPEFAPGQPRRSVDSGIKLGACRCDGSAFPADISLSSFQWQGQALILAVVRDESEARPGAAGKPRSHSGPQERDALTGLFAPAAIDACIASAAEVARIELRPVALIIGDVDRLRRINELCGYAVGDEVLRRIARTLETGTRASDLVGRHGGGRFAIVLRGADARQARRRAEAICQRLHDTPPATDHAAAGPVTMSFGVAALAEHGIDAAQLYAQAERALVRAKTEGGGCVRLPPNVDEDVQEPVTETAH